MAIVYCLLCIILDGGLRFPVSKLAKSVISELCVVCNQQSSEGQWQSWVLSPIPKI